MACTESRTLDASNDLSAWANDMVWFWDKLHKSARNSYENCAFSPAYAFGGALGTLETHDGVVTHVVRQRRQRECRIYLSSESPNSSDVDFGYSAHKRTRTLGLSEKESPLGPIISFSYVFTRFFQSEDAFRICHATLIILSSAWRFITTCQKCSYDEFWITVC